MNQLTTHGRVSSLVYLNQADIVRLGGDHSDLYVDALKRALALHARGEFAQPLKPYLRWRQGGHIADRIIAMPAYVGGDAACAGLKWIGSKHDNPAARGLARASAVIVLNDVDTHFPVAILEGSLISAMRTAAVTAIAAQHLARAGFTEVTALGCGVIAHTQLQTMLEQFPAVAGVHLYDTDPAAAARLANALHGHFPHVACRIAASAEEAVRAGEVVITCTVAAEPYLPYAWLRPGSLVSNVSIMDVHPEVFLKADKVVVDDWEQCNREKKTINQLVLEGKFSRGRLHAELGEVVLGRKPGREHDDEIILLNPMGMAIEDIACAQVLYQRACRAGVGACLDLYGDARSFEAPAANGEERVHV